MELDGYFPATIMEWAGIVVLHEYDMTVRINLKPMLPFADFIWNGRKLMKIRLFFQIHQIAAAFPLLKRCLIKFLQGKAGGCFQLPERMERFLSKFCNDGSCYFPDCAFYRCFLFRFPYTVGMMAVQ